MEKAIAIVSAAAIGWVVPEVAGKLFPRGEDGRVFSAARSRFRRFFDEQACPRLQRFVTVTVYDNLWLAMGLVTLTFYPFDFGMFLKYPPSDPTFWKLLELEVLFDTSVMCVTLAACAGTHFFRDQSHRFRLPLHATLRPSDL